MSPSPRGRDSGGQPGDDAENGQLSLPPFFNTTFSTHRLSPLFVGPQRLDEARLNHLAHRLRDTLVGDVVRGIQIGLEATDTSTGQVGPLKTVTFQWFRANDILGDEASPQGASVTGQPASWRELSDEQKRGLWIEIRHENAAYVAILLPALSRAKDVSPSASFPWMVQPPNEPQPEETDQTQFLHLPLLLLRMPQQLKAVIGEWLSTTFDCRISKLNLGTKTLITVWESWIEVMGLPRSNSDLVLTLAFNAPIVGNDQVTIPDSIHDSDDINMGESGMKTMDISISASDLRRFLRAGKSLQKSKKTTPSTASWESDIRERRRLAGPNADDGWGWRKEKTTPDHPFTEALAEYLNHHMALNLFHPSVRVTQMSCGSFILGQSRLKIVQSGDVTEDLSRAAWMFVMQLGERINTNGMPPIT